MTLPYSKIIDGIPPSGIRKFFDLVANSDNVISLGVGEPDFVTPWNIREEAIYSLEKGFTSYTSNNGMPECRQAISDYVKKNYTASYNPETEILVTTGVSQGIDITLRSILNPGDEVIIPEPTFVCYGPLVHLAGGKPVGVNTSDTQLIPDPKRLAKTITKKTKAIILCSPNNPTGMVIPKPILIDILKLAERHNLWVISDEIYADLVYDEPYHSVASLPNAKRRTILLNGFSKAFAMTGWRLGYICAPQDLIERTLKIHQYAMMCAPTIAQHAAIEALKHSKKDVQEMKKSYFYRRNYFVNKLNEIGLPTLVPKGAFYCFPSIKPSGLNSEDFCTQLLKTQNVACVPGNAFGKSGEGHIRCCYASSLDDLKEALNRIEKFLKGVRK